MKLSKQERIGALIILAIVILALGAFLLIKPKFEEVSTTKSTLEARQNELTSLRARQQLKGSLREEIEAEYEEGEHLADMFFPELTSYDAHRAFIDFIKQVNVPVVVEQLDVTEPTTETLNISFYTPTDVTYALKTYVTQGLEPSEEEARFEMRNLLLRAALASSQTIGASNVNFTASFLSRDDMIAFVDAVNDYKVKEEGAEDEVRKAIRVNMLSVDYEEVATAYNHFVDQSSTEVSNIGRALLREAGFEGYDGGEAPGATELPETVFQPIYTFTDTLTFLSIERMQNPKALLDAQDGIVEE